jgi:drug/metabolite transporter (DMT)-like permease
MGQRGMSRTPGPVLATGAMLGAALSLLPLALVEAPATHPDRSAILALLALAVLGTAFAQLVMYRLIDLVGARKMSLVTYLMPAFALVYGALLLDESVTLPVLAGLGMILAGVALGSGTIAATRRRRPAEVPG